jgi:cytochrome P450
VAAEPGPQRRRLATVDPLDPAVMADPYPVYAALRAAGPVCRVGPASWGVTRHREVAALLRDRRLANALPEADPQLATPDPTFRRLLPTRAPAEHRELVEVVARALGPAAARTRRDRLTALADELLAPARDTRTLDAVADLAYPLAATSACELIGLPAETVPELWPRIGDLARAFTPYLPDGERDRAEAALDWLRARVGAQLDHAGAGGLLSGVRRLGGLDRPDIVDNIAFLYFTAFETTMNMVATGCLGLARDPAAQAGLRADPALIPHAVEEFVRWDSPIQYTARLAVEPVRLGEHTIRPGRPVFLLLGAANHDERVFGAPQELDVRRHPNPHVGFGGGVRGCVGAALARLEGAVVFGRLLRTFATVSLAAEPVRRPSALFRSHRALPLAVTPV